MKPLIIHVYNDIYLTAYSYFENKQQVKQIPDLHEHKWTLTETEARRG